VSASEPHKPEVKRNRTRLLTLCGVILVLAVFISLLIAPNNLEVPFALTFGWIQFLRRTVPQID
jgi:uncharacterized integral membrane protein